MCRFSPVKILISIPEESAKYSVSLFQIQPTTKTIIPAHALTIGKKQHANIRWEFPFGKNLLQFHLTVFVILLNRFTLFDCYKNIHGTCWWKLPNIIAQMKKRGRPRKVTNFMEKPTGQQKQPKKRKGLKATEFVRFLLPWWLRSPSYRYVLS